MMRKLLGELAVCLRLSSPQSDRANPSNQKHNGRRCDSAAVSFVANVRGRRTTMSTTSEESGADGAAERRAALTQAVRAIAAYPDATPCIYSARRPKEGGNRQRGSRGIRAITPTADREEEQVYENEMTKSGGYDMRDRELLAQALRSRIAALESILCPNDVERRDLEILAEMLECVEERGPEMPTIAGSR